MGNVNYSGSIMKEPFTKDELQRLKMRFRKIDTDHSGGLSIAEFMKLPGISENPLANRIVNIFDTDKNGEVDFNVAFQVYDIDQDGFISNGELYQVLKTMVEDNLTDVQLQQLVDKTIVYFDKDNDGKLSFAEFSQVLSTMNKLLELSKHMEFSV